MIACLLELLTIWWSTCFSNRTIAFRRTTFARSGWILDSGQCRSINRRLSSRYGTLRGRSATVRSRMHITRVLTASSWSSIWPIERASSVYQYGSMRSRNIQALTSKLWSLPIKWMTRPRFRSQMKKFSSLSSSTQGSLSWRPAPSMARTWTTRSSTWPRSWSLRRTKMGAGPTTASAPWA